jgi:hypothetical protein
MTTESRQSETLAFDRAEKFLRRERVAQQIGVGLLTLLVVAGAAGLFGNGPLSAVTTTSGGLTIRYERFARQSFRTSLQIEAAAPSPGPAAIRLSRHFIDRVDVVEMRPPGALTQLDREFAIFEVPSSSGAAFLEVQYEPKHYGVLESQVRLDGQSMGHLRQVVFF